MSQGRKRSEIRNVNTVRPPTSELARSRQHSGVGSERVSVEATRSVSSAVARSSSAVAIARAPLSRVSGDAALPLGENTFNCW